MEPNSDDIADGGETTSRGRTTSGVDTVNSETSVCGETVSAARECEGDASRVDSDRSDWSP